MQPAEPHADASARLMLVLLSFAWGLTWPAMRFALAEIPPFSMRVGSLGLGALTLLAILAARRRAFLMRGAKAWAHVFVAGLLNIVSFTMLSAYALLDAATPRVAILSYTMPIWAAVMAWLVLGERLTGARLLALALCAAGMTVLIYPLAGAGLPGGLMLALATAVSWAAGTVYLKWASIEGDPATAAAWQVTFGFLVVVICLPFVEGSLHLSQAHAPALLGMAYTGLAGSGLAYFLWFGVVHRLPATTASLGVLSVPAIGMVFTAILVGEKPTVSDMIGFVLIFAAAACVLLPSRERPAPEPS